MQAATVLLCTELLRLSGPTPDPSDLVRLILATVPDGVSRSRGAAKYHAAIGIPGLVDPVAVVDARGYPVRWSMSQAASFLAKALPGTAHPVQIELADASKLPARWTDARLASLAGKLAALDPAAIRAQAAAKRATVEEWAEGERKTAVLAASARMDQCAGVVEAIRSGDPFNGARGGGGGGGGGGEEN